MTWALVIGCWVTVALVVGLVIGAMIRRAEAKEQEAEARPSVLIDRGHSSSRPPAGRNRRRFHPIE